MWIISLRFFNDDSIVESTSCFTIGLIDQIMTETLRDLLKMSPFTNLFNVARKQRFNEIVRT